MSQAIQPMYASRSMRKAEVVAWFQQHSSTAAQQHAHAEDVGGGDLPNHDG